MIFNYVSLTHIIEKVNRLHIPHVEYNIEELREWTYEALSFIGVQLQNIELSRTIEIKEGKSILPEGMEELLYVLEGDTNYPMEHINPEEGFRDLTYKLNAGYIFTDFDDGSVVLNYTGFPIDEDNNPLIPDDIYYISAVEAYIKLKLGERLFWQSKIAQGQFNYLEREWGFYCQGAVNSSRKMSLDQTENFKRKILKHFPDFNRRSTPKRGSNNYYVVNRSVL